jgi:hypothetical protein
MRGDDNMTEKKFLVKTKSGSIYPVEIKGGMLGKKKMIMLIRKEEATITAITKESKPVPAFSEKLKPDTAKLKNLVPGNILVFKTENKKVGNTSRIAEVYKKVA